MVNAHLVVTKKGCILVDTGLPGSEVKVEKTLVVHGLSLKDIKLIVVTHAHVDHAGSAVRLRELTRAPIIGHEGDVQYYAGEKQMTYCSTGWPGSIFLKTPIPHEPYSAFKPDILLSNATAFDLDRYGVPGTIKHSPGHTTGSISLELESKDALVGDLVASGILIGGITRKGRAIRPPFEDDPQAVAFELKRLLEAGFERFYMGHGGPLDAEEVRRHVRTLMVAKRSTPSVN
jgi:glyoxylase-like metal-dependent hydrolase (beta-lactamase superfamily II)